jgi:hypothetical protein
MTKTIEDRRAYQREWLRADREANPDKYRKRRQANLEKYRERERRYRATFRASNLEKTKERARKSRGQPFPTRPMPTTCECCGKISPLKLDHCHVSGKFRGWLCFHCNTGLGKLGDSIEGLMNAVRYLQRAAGERP